MGCDCGRTPKPEPCRGPRYFRFLQCRTLPVEHFLPVGRLGREGTQFPFPPRFCKKVPPMEMHIFCIWAHIFCHFFKTALRNDLRRVTRPKRRVIDRKDAASCPECPPKNGHFLKNLDAPIPSFLAWALGGSKKPKSWGPETAGPRVYPENSLRLGSFSAPLLPRVPAGFCGSQLPGSVC